MAIQPTGTISLRFAGPAARAISSTAKVRVYLYTYDSSTGYGLHTFANGSPYQEFAYGGGTDSLSGVPTGLWDVLVSIGTDGPGKSFYVTRYGDSGVIDVVGGADTSASVTTKASPFAYSTQLAGQNLNSVVWNYLSSGGASIITQSTGGTASLYVSSTSSLSSIIPSLPGSPPSLSVANPVPITLPSGVQVNSISQGMAYEVSVSVQFPSYALFVNTNKGIIPYFPGASTPFDTSFSSNLGSGGTTYDVGNSVATEDSTMNYGIPIFYSRNGGLGGVYLSLLNAAPYLNSFSGTASWVDIPSTGTGNPVSSLSSDFYTNDAFTYVATKGGAFRAAPSLVTSGSTSAGNLSSTVKIPSPNSAPIVSIAVDDYDGLLYVGTTDGAYYATLNETGATSATSATTGAVRVCSRFPSHMSGISFSLLSSLVRKTKRAGDMFIVVGPSFKRS